GRLREPRAADRPCGDPQRHPLAARGPGPRRPLGRAPLDRARGRWRSHPRSRTRFRCDGASMSVPAAAPAPAVSPTTVPVEEEAVVGAESLKDAVAEHSMTIGEGIEWLDAMGFTVGDTRFSLWSALVVLLVILGVYVLARIGVWIARSVIHRVSRLDATQHLLAEKVVSIVIWALAILIGIDILGIDLTALAVFSGAFGLAIGFGLQKTFGNLIAGIILLT